MDVTFHAWNISRRQTPADEQMCNVTPEKTRLTETAGGGAESEGEAEEKMLGSS